MSNHSPQALLPTSAGFYPTDDPTQLRYWDGKQWTKRTARLANPWANTKVIGNLSRKASDSILNKCNGNERPWFILTSSGGAGTLVAFDDRCYIIKTGALTGFMAGATGGERSATFYYRDITGIEYNSGFVTGVLQILTPSYDGTPNRDFWRGSSSSRNADANNPWTLTNTLPLNKAEYQSALKEINQLKLRISHAKQVNVRVVTNQPQAQAGMADQIARLAKLKDAGALTEEEFIAAKKKILGI